jgi:putative nucleotidyltransferase with HDIG domain
MERELPAAKKVYEDALSFAKGFIHKAYLEKNVDVERSEEFVDDVITSVVRNREALTGLCKLRVYDEYTYTHSINVTVLAAAIGQFLGLPEAELRPLGLAALFHDVGKANIPIEVLNKPGRLDAREFTVMKRHPLESYEILKDKGALAAQVLPAIVEHHEKYDGSGYPRGLSGEDISMFARIVSLADVYDALTSDRATGRAFRRPMPWASCTACAKRISIRPWSNGSSSAWGSIPWAASCASATAVTAWSGPPMPKPRFSPRSRPFSTGPCAPFRSSMWICLRTRNPGSPGFASKRRWTPGPSTSTSRRS